MIDLIKIDADSPVPKYKQLIDSIHQALEMQHLKKNEKIPSINEICRRFTLSRDTVLTAFSDLQARGIITSKPGKGYYINKVSTNHPHKIFLLFDKLSPYKEILYNSIKDELKRKGTVDIYFHHFNAKIFDTLIHDSIGQFTAYVVMPIPSKSIASSLKQIPKDKLYILDRGRRIFGQTYPSVCQNFKKDVYEALQSGNDLIDKYKKLCMVYPDISNIPSDIKRGFEQYCKERNFSYAVHKVHAEPKIQKGTAYLIFDDKNLVTLVKQARAHQLELGKDVGIISYNDTPLKSVVANGITTISTDFEGMGRTLVQMILNKKRDHIENPCRLIRRNSL